MQRSNLRIFKYQIDSVTGGIEMPLGAEVLTAGWQLGLFCVWAVVNPANPPARFAIRRSGPGLCPWPHLRCLGTVELPEGAPGPSDPTMRWEGAFVEYPDVEDGITATSQEPACSCGRLPWPHDRGLLCPRIFEDDPAFSMVKVRLSKDRYATGTSLFPGSRVVGVGVGDDGEWVKMALAVTPGSEEWVFYWVMTGSPRRRGPSTWTPSTGGNAPASLS